MNRHCQRVLIDASVKATTHHDFRCDVIGGSDQEPRCGQRVSVAVSFLGRDCLDDAEIAQERVAVAIEQNIRRLDVAVNMILRVQKIDCLGDLE